MPRKGGRRRRRERIGYVVMALLAAVIIGVLYLTANTGDQFVGELLRGSLQGRLEGTVQADTNCRSTARGLTTCTAIITTRDGQRLDFKYTHDMSKEGCLRAGDRVYIERDGGAVKVTREK